MAELWTPLEAERDRAIEYRLHKDVAEGAQLERELKTLDERLEVGFIGERAPAYPGVKPGRWHIIRRNPGAPDSFMPILGANGEYLEPSHAIIERLKANDLWKDGAVQKLMENYERKWVNQEKAAESAKESMREQAAFTYKAAKRVSDEGGMEKRVWGKGG